MDERPQKRYISKEETVQPTVSLEALTTTLIIGAYEKRNVAIYVVPGSYLNALMPTSSWI